MGNCYSCNNEDDEDQMADSTSSTAYDQSSQYEVRQRLLMTTNSAGDPPPEDSEETKRQVLMLQRKSMMVHLPCREFKGNALSECTICMEEFGIGEMVRSLPCFHTFHQKCIDDWLSRSFTCPSCLEPINSALLLSYDVHR